MTYQQSPYDTMCAHCGRQLARAGGKPRRCGCRGAEFWITRETLEIAGTGATAQRIQERLQSALRAKQARAREERDRK